MNVSNTHDIWNNSEFLNSLYQGAPPLGNGEQTEAPYRIHEEARTFCKLAKLGSKDTILELGCGSGRWAVSLAPLVGHYTGVDFSRQLLNIAQANCKSVGIENVEFIESSVENFHATRTFSIIYLSGLTQYLEDNAVHALISRASNWLVDGGMIIDRSTFGRTQRSTINTDSYFSIYRTTGELDTLFKDTSMELQCRRESYAYFCFSKRISRFLRKPFISSFLFKNRKWCYPLLRAACQIGLKIFKKPGDMAQQIHLFSMYKASPPKTA